MITFDFGDMSRDVAKRAVAYAAADDIIALRPRTIGLGSGSTIVHCMERFRQRRDEIAHAKFIPTSLQAAQLISNCNFEQGTSSALSVIDVTVDGADSVDANFFMYSPLAAWI